MCEIRWLQQPSMPSIRPMDTAGFQSVPWPTARPIRLHTATATYWRSSFPMPFALVHKLNQRSVSTVTCWQPNRTTA